METVMSRLGQILKPYEYNFVCIMKFLKTLTCVGGDEDRTDNQLLYMTMQHFKVSPSCMWLPNLGSLGMYGGVRV